MISRFESGHSAMDNHMIVIQEWMLQEPDALREWLQDPNGPSKIWLSRYMFEIGSLLFRTRARVDHEHMVRWMSGFEEPRYVRTAMERWVRSHPAEVEEFIASGNAPASAVNAYNVLKAKEAQ